MKDLKIVACLFVYCSLVACTKDGTPKTPVVKPSVYVTGYGSYGTVVSGSAYWKDGVLTPLSGGQFATGIAFIDTNVYVAGNAGYMLPAGGYATEAVYWKNGVMVKLGNPPSYASSIAISGTDVYIAGIAEVNNIYSAVYWKNGVLDTLSNMPYSVANAIAVSGNDVYVAGNAGNNGYQAVLWKNGIQVPLENSVASRANAIALSGPDVYIAGLVVTGSNTNAAVYWKNGVRVNLNPASTDTTITNTYASAIAVSGANVYVTGYMNNSYALYWKNGAQTVLNNPNTSPNATNNINGIVVSGSDVYISFNNCAYWRNDTVVRVGSGYATNLAVR